MAGYHVALQDEPLEAVMRVVGKLVRGTWGDQVTFCPRPPELANMVREEVRRLRVERAPKISYQPVGKPSMLAQMEVKYRHRKVLGENVEMKAFRPTDWPVGACFVPILCKVFAAEEKRPPRPYHEPKGE